MNVVKAVFVKQAKDTLRNPAVLVMYIIFPAVALVMTELVVGQNDAIPPNMFVSMMGSIFAGMALITSMSGVIAEDIEKKSLRFLVIAGVKPRQYLLGTGGFIFCAGAVTSLLFALIGTFTAAEFAKFLAVMVGSVAASTLLGATIGVLSKNLQAATAIGMPIAMIIGFTPMIASFNKTVEKYAGLLYTQQLNVIVNNLAADAVKPLLVIAINIVVLAVLFTFAYSRRGLRA